MPVDAETISLDRLMADVEDKSSSSKTVDVKNDPPAIFYSSGSAILLIVPGDPVLAPVPKTNMQFIVNANWDLFFDKSKKEYYLLADKLWYSADSLKGSWAVTNALPKDMSRLPSGENFDEVKKAIPPATGTGEKVLFSNIPAELIVTKGSPVFTKIPGTSLLYISNTDNDVFLHDLTKKYYVLISGRWFSAASMDGPWAYAGNDLPKDFAAIPEHGPKAGVKAFVPGTQAASDAVLLAQIPETALVNKAEAAAKVKVVYDGNRPEFKPIEGTSLQYATNTQDKVIQCGDLYYLCFQAVWFKSVSPQGPWETAASVPDEIYKIPSGSPVYNVTYVHQVNVSETTVESSTTAGYFGAFIIGVGIGACIAYGTGWYYPPYLYRGPGMLCPVYRPWPCTYGAGYRYNPWIGGFAAHSRVYGPYGAAGTSAWYNPATGRYGHAATVQGAYGGRTVAHAYNPWTGSHAATAQGHNPYAQWGSSVATRNGQWAQTGHITNGTGTTAGYRTSTGQRGVIHKGANGTVIKGNNGVYAGHDGNVYRKNASGNWSVYKNGQWQQSVGGNRGTQQQLNNAAASRERGRTQTQHFQQAQRRSFSRPSRGGGFHRR